MGFFESLLVKFIGKRIDADLTKWNISKTKVAVWVGIIVVEAPRIATALGHPFVVPPDVLQVLAALGLWGLRDGIDSSGIVTDSTGTGTTTVIK